MARADIRIAIKDPAIFNWSNFDLGHGERARVALRVLFERAGKSGEVAPHVPAESPRTQAAITGIFSDDATEVSEADEEPELDEVPAFADDSLSMALVFHRTDNRYSSTIWPDEKTADQKKKSPPDLDIVFWFPFELDRQGKIVLPRDPKDRWPRVVRPWLDPQPATDRKDLPDPIGHLDSYRQALKTFFASSDKDASFASYIDGCCGVFDDRYPSTLMRRSTRTPATVILQWLIRARRLSIRTLSEPRTR